MNTRNFWPAVMVLVMAACSGGNSEEPVREVGSYTIEQFMDNKAFQGMSFSPDESKLLLSNNETGIFNAYEVPFTGGDLTQLSKSDNDAVWTIGYFPNDERFLYSSDQGGNELNHIYIRELDGSIRDLTPDSAKAQFMGWARNLDAFYFMSNKRDARYMDVYKMYIDDFRTELLYQNNEGLDVSAISNDERYLALIQAITNAKNNLYLLDLSSGEKEQLFATEEDINYFPEEFSNDGAWLYFQTNEASEFMKLERYHLTNKNRETVFETNWDVMYAYTSWNEKYRVVGVNDDGKTIVHIFDLSTGKKMPAPELDGVEITGVSISRSETKMAFYAGGSHTPSNLYSHDFGTGTTTRLTHSLHPDINPDDMVVAEVVRFKSFDGTDIPNILYKPHQASADNPVPAMVWVHGGPGGQTRQNWSSMIQYMVNNGYAVLGINNRGSSGYGKTFFHMDDLRHGDVDLKDCVYGRNYLAGLDWVDSTKIGIIGGSYGGYMTMAALTYEPEVFDVGVNIFGVTNWLRTLQSIPPWWESFRKALYTEMGDPATDSLRLYNISPLFHTDRIQRPFMVLQGANDPRVLQVESDEIVENARANGVTVEYLLFPDEGHGFVKKENNIKAWKDIVTFLNTHLKGMKPTEG